MLNRNTAYRFAIASVGVLLLLAACATQPLQPENRGIIRQTESPCCPKPEGTVGHDVSDCLRDSEGDIDDFGYQTKGKRRAWLHKTTGDYCAEEGAAVRFPGGPWIDGPREGNYYEEQQKP